VIKVKMIPRIARFILLAPLSVLWDAFYRFRRFAYNYDIFKQNDFRVPIISVGNLTFGGTGKTPFTLWLADYLESLDLKVMILMRGYKGRLEHGVGILRAGKRLGFNPRDYGDEALLLSRRLKNSCVVVGKRRSENLEYYFNQEYPDVVLLDDGHQHLKLARDINIVLFDCLMPLERYKTAPLGYMREGFSGLKDADVIVLGRSDQVDEIKKNALKELIQSHLKHYIPMVEVSYGPVGLFNSQYELVYELHRLKGLKVVAVAGVASPDSFFKLLEKLGVELLLKESFPDHHSFKADEINRLISSAIELEALLVTTEKDMVKLRRLVDHPRLVYLEIRMEFLKGEKETKEIISKAFL
jgi:tetraacyldisaccharide 4'-kinase